MMMIGQPKSASTSLMKTLAKMWGIRYQNGISKNASYRTDCPGYKTIQSYHGTMAQRDLPFFGYGIEKKDCLYKEHVLPIQKHVDAVAAVDRPILILLRNPEHSFDNYVRLRAAYLAGKISKKSNSILHAEKFVRMDMEGLRRDLIAFYLGWKDAAGAGSVSFV